jgi:hypothetical protein
VKRCRLEARHQSDRPVFLAAISHPDLVLAARDAANREDSTLILDNLKPPPNLTFEAAFGGTLVDRLRDLDGREGLIDSERTSDDGREVDVTYWTEVDDDTEARVVGTIAYSYGCWAAKMPLPTGGIVENVD